MVCDKCGTSPITWVGYEYENGIPKGKTDLCEECAPTTGEVLSDMTGREKEEFEPEEYDHPDLDELEEIHE